MKVLQLSSEIGWRGGERQVAYLISELRARKVEAIIAGRKGSALEKFCNTEKFVFIPVAMRNSLDVVSAFSIKNICLNYNIDIIHAQTALAHSNAVVASTLGNKVPIVLSRRVAFPPRTDWFTKWKYNHSAIKKVICVSDKAREIVGNLIRDYAKLVTIYSGIDLSRFVRPDRDVLKEQYDVPDHVFRIGNAAALEEEKDYTTFIRVIARLKQKGFAVHGIIAGKGSQELTLKSLAQSLNIQNDITFTGHVTNVEDILYGFDIFMMTSRSEGLGTAILDAFATGTAVVATAAGGIPELVINEETGLLAPVGDDETLAGHVEMLIQNPQMRERLKTAASKHVTEFSKEIMAEKTLDIYREVIRAVQPSKPR